MGTTPLIRTPQADGGTFYTFSSGARDFSKTISNDNLRFVFSKFVLLNIPDFNRLDLNTFSNYQNYMQFDTIDGMIFNGGLKSDPNINWAESLQNYALNIEELIMSDVDYDSSTNRTPTERIFFKWLKETGAIRFRNATSLEQSQSVSRQLFVEEDENTSGIVQYRRVVKYIGEIDIVNNVDKSGESYTELYINVPTEVGNTPTILFDSIADSNYQPGLKIQGENEYILGRGPNTAHPQGLSTLAFYDYDQPLQGAGPGGYTDPNANWMDESTPPTSIDSYFTEPNTFTDASNIDIRKYPADYNNPIGFSGVAYRRNNLDGISIDFNANDYQQITSNQTIATIPQFNGTDLSGNFEFNAVLVYYDLRDISNSSNTATNLYGILLLDNIIPTTDGGFIQRYPKFKPNRVTGQNGNSYGFKINLRIDASPGTSGIDTIINDYNTFSMGLFSEATAQLQQSVRIFERQRIELSELSKRVSSLENIENSSSDISVLQSQIEQLKNQIDNSSIALTKSSSILDLIAKNADEIQSLANGTVTRTLQYNTNVVRQGPGIIVDKNTPNVITLSLGTQQYNFMNPTDINGNDITLTSPLNINVATPTIFADLQPFTNMLRLSTANSAGGDLIININDDDIQFKTGQTIRLIFETPLNIGSRNIKIYTDSLNRLNSGNYGIQIASISNNELSSKPIIELICTEQGILSFTYDVIR